MADVEEDFIDVTSNGLDFTYDPAWKRLTDSAQEITRRTGFPLEPFWDAVNRDDYNTACSIIKDMQRYRKKDRWFYEREPRSHFGKWVGQ